MAPSNSTKTEARRTTVRNLDRAPRGLVLLLGLSGLLTGGLAVFKSDNQAGTVALLTVGAIASLLALVGKVPLRWVIGGNEIDMSEEAAERAADAVAAQLPPEEAKELAKRIAGSNTPHTSTMASAMLDYVAFEQIAIAQVGNAIASAELPREYLSADPQSARLGIDGLVSGIGDVQVPVVYKFSRQPDGLLHILRRMSLRALETGALRGCVIVVPTIPMTPRFRMLISQMKAQGMFVVAQDDPDFSARLIAACDRVAKYISSLRAKTDSTDQ